MDNLTRGGQSTMNNIHMWLQITKILSSVFILTTLIVALISAFFIFNWVEVQGAFIYALAKLKGSFFALNHGFEFTWAGVHYKKTVGFVLNSTYFYGLFQSVFSDTWYCLMLGAVAGVPVSYAVQNHFSKQGKALSEDKFVRGMQLVKPKILEAKLKKSKTVSSLSFDEYFIFKRDFEVQHMLLDGTTGSGKSLALRKLLNWIRTRGDKAIIYDKGCSFVGKFYDSETDYIMNPFDDRCVNWDLWSDGSEDTDFENMASALIPMHGEGDPFWVHAARSIFSSAAFQMQKESHKSTTQFLELLLKSSLENLGTYLKGTESESLVSEKIEKTAISIKSVLATYIKSLRFLDGLDKDEHGHLRENFSIKQWVGDDLERGWLFLSSNAQQHASLRPLISMWLSIASTAILGLEEDYNRRIWVIVDEAPSLHKLPELPETIAEVRKFGGCYVIGIQSVAQLRKVYGMNAANEVFDLLNTRLFFRSPSHDMASITSKELGEEEIEVCKDNRSVGPNPIRDGVTFGFQSVKRPIVSTAEVMKIPDLSFYLRTPGEYPVCRFDMRFDNKENVAKSFKKRKFQKSDAFKRVEALATHYQLGVLERLSSEDLTKLMKMQEGSFDDKDKDLSAMRISIDQIKNKKPKSEANSESNGNEKPKVKRTLSKQKTNPNAITEEMESKKIKDEDSIAF